MPTVALAPVPTHQFFDSNGDPLTGGLLYTYVVGTTTPKATYTDATGNSANENPIELDSRGEASIFILTDANYKWVLKTAAGVTIWTRDNFGFANPTYEDANVTDDLVVGGDVTVTGTLTATSVVIGDWIYIKQPDQTATITTGTAKVSLPAMPACTILAVRAGLVTASSSGIPTFDINDDGVSIFDTAKLTIDANELTSLTAAASPTILNPTVASGSLLTMDIDVAGTGAKGWVILLNVRLT